MKYAGLNDYEIQPMSSIFLSLLAWFCL